MLVHLLDLLLQLAPKLKGSGKGDVLARIRIQVPKRVNKKERELLEELKKVES